MFTFTKFQVNTLGLIVSYVSISILSFFSPLFIKNEGSSILLLGLIAFVVYMVVLFKYYILQRFSIPDEKREGIILNISTFALFISAFSLTIAEFISNDIFIFSETSVYLIIGITTSIILTITLGTVFILRNIAED